MNAQTNNYRRDFLKQSVALAAGLSFIGSVIPALKTSAAPGLIYHPGAGITAAQFRATVMPRAQLSIQASQLAVNKCGQKNAKEFSGFELEEAHAVVNVLTDTHTPVPPMSQEGKDLIAKLQSLSGNEFDRLYMQAQLSNHEFLAGLAKDYLEAAKGRTSADEKETQHLATLALYAFHEHVALCKRIYGEVMS